MWRNLWVADGIKSRHMISIERIEISALVMALGKRDWYETTNFHM